MNTIAYFITPHGFGHASRAAAVMAALSGVIPSARFEIFTTSPRWIFETSVPAPFGYHRVVTDIGMVQRSPLKADIDDTCRRLDRLLPYDETLVARLARLLADARCRMVICDIAALGIVAARAAGLPSILVESFTWDWIYTACAVHNQCFEKHIEYLRSVYAMADRRVQTEPVCWPHAGAVTVAPVSRKANETRGAIRAKLGVDDRATLVLVSMGGIPDRFVFLEHLPKGLNCHLVVSGAPAGTPKHARVTPLPAQSPFSHPDLLQAADVLIGKAGYSTVAEAYYAGIPFGYISRTDSPETPSLATFIQKKLPARAISANDYATGRWLQWLDELSALPRTRPAHENGADAVARLLCDYCK